MNRAWTAWVSQRFLSGRQGGRGRLIFFFSVILIALGVMTLNCILAVMNGHQQGFIQSILEIGSYHLRWYSPDDSLDRNQLIRRLESETSVKIALVFREGQTMLNGISPRPQGALLRGLPNDAYIRDESMASRLKIVSGSFDLSGNGIVLGDQLAYKLGVDRGDNLTLLNFSGSGTLSDDREFLVTGLFSSDYQEYEASMAFISLENAGAVFGDIPLEIGIKLHRIESDQAMIEQLKQAGFPGTFISWRESNRAFFGALRTEKAIMLLLLTLIFVVVSVNIDHSLRRMTTERIEDLSILKALGASPAEVRILFLRHGFVIGGLGGGLGTLLGVLIGMNVSRILRWFQTIRSLLFPFWGSSLRARTLESFFRNSQVLLQDVLIILLLAMILSFLAALRASSMAALSKPAEVLRSE